MCPRPPPFRALPPLLGAVAQYVLLWQSVGVSASGVAGTFSRGGDFPRGMHPPMAPLALSSLLEAVVISSMERSIHVR